MAKEYDVPMNERLKAVEKVVSISENLLMIL